MGKIKKYKNGIERFLRGEKGQRFFNFAYSIGAAIVIWGALFKILHLPMGNLLLCIGMGTEVVMFILTAFDRPPKEYNWEEVFPVLGSKNPEDRPNFNGGGGGIVGGGGVVYAGGEGISGEGLDGVSAPSGGVSGSGVIGGGGIIIAGGVNFAEGSDNVGSAGNGPIEINVSGQAARQAVGLPSGVNLSEEDTLSLRESISKMAAASEQLSQMAELTTATQQYLSQMAAISEQMQQLKDTTMSLNQVSGVLLDSYRAITENSENITRSSTGYVDQLENLNRNIGGLNTIYEIQLKSISSQLDSIDRVNRGLKDIRDMYEKSANESSRYCEETEKMARYMKQLNQVYEKMITAMTINMHNPMMGGQPMNPFNNTDENA